MDSVRFRLFFLSSFHISCDDDFKYDLYSDQVGVQTSYILKMGKFFGMFHCTITTTTRFGECSGYILYTTSISFRPVTHNSFNNLYFVFAQFLSSFVSRCHAYKPDGSDLVHMPDSFTCICFSFYFLR